MGIVPPHRAYEPERRESPTDETAPRPGKRLIRHAAHSRPPIADCSPPEWVKTPRQERAWKRQVVVAVAAGIINRSLPVAFIADALDVTPGRVRQIVLAFTAGAESHND